MAALIVKPNSNPDNNEIYYLYTDHLGSLIAVYNEDGGLEEEFSYDPWGRRRDPDAPNDYIDGSHELFTRGFTFHSLSRL